ncbi:MAG: leucine--tRNA ligase [Oscillospiraceae bacterium]|jgi:leucyl-tRNA synthetase|nr:leucine--tRNA ligase [Oscillospiraceae bacterium]
MKYNFTEIEKKWQSYWDEHKTFAATQEDSKEKFYALIEFPYPSGDGLHVGHARPYTAMDIVARKRRKLGQNVLFPIGFDSFGLPTENFAIKNKVHPADVTKRNITRFTEQLKALGYSFDWDRAVETTDPAYYKWTQWIFIKMFEKGLAYKQKMPVNWCPSCNCVLANEEAQGGVCERCGSPVVRREKSQWMLKITEYAERLLDDLDTVDFIERVKVQQKNWIGKSTGASVTFAVPETGDKLTVFTTRPDTLFGVTYMVVSPEHALVEQWLTSGAIKNAQEVTAYRDAAARKSDFERTETAKDKTGASLDGITAENPANGEKIPVFISDYVLATYGTGAIMAVPGHDTRDWEFAKVFGLPIIEVVAGGDVEKEAFTDCETGQMVNSGFLNGLAVSQAKEKITAWLEDGGLGHKTVNFKLRDWVFARQRYWGEPIPMVYCEHCGYVPLPESELPLVLPQVENYEPTTTGESPLSKMTDWVNVKCLKCGHAAKRETDTMPQWAGSSWYFLRYADPKNSEALASKEALDYWTPVDWYNGGMEHTTLHLLYSRFWHKFLYDIGVAPTAEPYKKRTSHGMILGADGQKMSKSRGNVVNPGEVIAETGADTLRLYIMFIGDFEKTAPWSPDAVKGCRRLLDRIWNLTETRRGGDDFALSKTHEKSVNRTIKKVGEDIEAMKFNTAIAALMSLVNEFYGQGADPSRGDIRTLLSLLSPFAPHIAEELWQIQGFSGLASTAPWPEYDETMLSDNDIPIAVQIGGKLKTTITVAADADEQAVIAAVLSDEKITRLAEGKELVRTIYVPGRLVNLIFKG